MDGFHPWLGESELRIGLGCMRLSTDEERDEDLAVETIAAAASAGMTVFDTARAYGHGAAELGHNERLLARALRSSGAGARARVVTKGGMTRAGDGWLPDGRAKAILADCEASLEALDGLAIDLYLVHAPDPRTLWRTTVRALNRLVDGGMVKRVGVSNVNRTQLDEALELAPLAAVEVALSPYDDSAMRGGILERCTELGIALIAHSPLGGPRRAARIERIQAIADIARAQGVTPAEAALAWLLSLSPAVVAIPGATRPETASSAAAAARLTVEAVAAPAARVARSGKGEVVLVMGIPGVGKTRIAADYTARGYARLNRDERGGTLRELATALDEALAGGAARIVLDSTYLTRASRSYVVDAARRHGAVTRCVWLDTPLAQAQVNLVERLLDHFGALPSPEQIKAATRAQPGLLMPTSQMRAQRELEPPQADEGWDEIEELPFERAPSGHERGGVFIAANALREPGWRESIANADPSAPHLVFDWGAEPLDTLVAELAAEVAGPVEGASCSHGGGPPSCWCRPPLPGLPLAFAREYGIDPVRSTLIGTSAAHRTLANALGATYAAP